MLQKYRGSFMRSKSPLEEQAYSILTPYAFKKFQDEFAMATGYTVLQINVSQFVVQYFDTTRSEKHVVFWNGRQAACSCKHFEFWGILRRHILSVFLHKDYFQIPDVYFLMRWRSDLLSQVTSNILLSLQQVESNVSLTINGNSGAGNIDYVHCPPNSKTKGGPSHKRMKREKDSVKRVKSCGFCKVGGHNITKCPHKKTKTSTPMHIGTSGKELQLNME
ncbi:putative protein FAR1-RELATED SEQUENCE 10 [Hevea brasiliensis]|uniref:putative protein FAR1-RELATED SEQUENCE 10 n=1 Tax=Hevea brasiliensis TaxID=3981 RepID=UPI0025D69748|nr:putative protein FAR1-RELATED SEQUENCE 10 [Hevea brasiliensis]